MKNFKNITRITLITILIIVAILTFVDMIYPLGVEDKIYDFLNTKIMRKFFVKIFVICMFLSWIFVINEILSNKKNK